MKSFLRFALALACFAPPAFAGQHGDFDGDGAEDAVFGNPFAPVNAIPQAGQLQVMYGVSGFGLGTAHQQIFDADTLSLSTTDAQELLGLRSAIGDFDGDGFDDLAFSAPGRAVSGRRGAGVVFVMYGSPTGLGNLETWDQDRPGMRDKVDSIDPDTGDSNDVFGWSLAANDFDSDGFADLAIGVHEKVSGQAHAGAVAILYGTSHGLDVQRNQLWSQDSPHVKDHAEREDSFGCDLATGDFDGDGYPDLAVGVAEETTKKGGFADSRFGAVQVLRGGKHGITARKNRIYRWTDFVKNDAHSEFGWHLAAGDFNGDGKSDLAIGDSYQSPSSQSFAGMVSVLYGSLAGLDKATFEQWSQDSNGLGMSAQEHEAFGEAVAAADVDGDGFDDLLVGSPGNNAIAPNAGAIVVLPGSASGLTAVGGKFWHQDSPGVAGNAEQDDFFGLALATGDFDGNGRPDVLIGIAGEEITGSAQDCGAVAVFYSQQDVGLDPEWRNNVYFSGLGGLLGESVTQSLFGCWLP